MKNLVISDISFTTMTRESLKNSIIGLWNTCTNYLRWAQESEDLAIQYTGMASDYYNGRARSARNIATQAQHAAEYLERILKEHY